MRDERDDRSASPSALPPPPPPPLPPPAHPRRRFLGLLGGATAAPALGGALAVPALPGTAAAAAIAPETPRARRAHAVALRTQVAATNLLLPLPAHPTNGDEERHPDRAGNHTKGLRHGADGVVDPGAYESLLRALRSGRPADFEAIEIGGTRRLVNPQGGLSFELEGIDPQLTEMPPPPPVLSEETAAEAVELYWMALLRDLPFSAYDRDPRAQAAAAELSALPAFRGPRVGGRVTTGTLFRDDLPGALVGPYLSQFFWAFTPLGSEVVDRRQRTSAPGIDFLTGLPEWLAVQNGAPPTQRLTYDSVRRLVRNGRDLGEWVHVDVLYQAFFEACLVLATAPASPSEDPVFGVQGGQGAPLDPGNPYRGSRTQDPFVTFGGPHIKTLVAEVARPALKAVWFHKWFVHRRLRPEEYGGLVERTRTGRRPVALPATILASGALGEVVRRTGSGLLPQAYPEGSPLHPSYGAGHAVVAGACATVLKAFFDETAPWRGPVEVAPDGLSVVPYTGATLTVGGELNKLASNIATGRNIAGVHWRSDGVEALRLGEAVAIRLLKEQRATLNESFGGFSLTRFDGTRVTI